MNLSENFTLDELTRSETALRKGLDNTPDAETVANLTELALALEKVRDLLGHPIHINSGYRSAKVNAAVGSKETSAHRHGWAADFVCPAFGTPQEICHAILDSTIDFDQLIWEFGSWVHISIDPRRRRVAMTIDSYGTRTGIA